MSTKEYSKAILASYVTYKELYKSAVYKSPYQILAEFIKYILCTEKLYSFSLVEMKKKINDIFEFDLPTAVIRTSLRKIDSITRCSNGEYVIDIDKISIDKSLKKYKEEAENKNDIISNLLIQYAEEKIGKTLDRREKQDLIKEFIAYLIDEANGNRYQDLISSFIIRNASNKEMTAFFDSVREGGILYVGLNYNIDETGSITNDLTLYLDMEILFDIYGYNGEVFQQLAMDLINLVQDANRKERKIKLKYFNETKDEIDLFFVKAEDIVTGRALIRDNVAMKAITKGCNDITDIIDRKADFYSKLYYTYGIVEDEKKEYYEKIEYGDNLEGWFTEEEKDADFHSSMKMVSHINKLRKGQRYYDYTKARYIFITDTWKTIDCSKKVVEQLKEDDAEYKMAGYAISMSMMTNILWYKLNKGFGGECFPGNVNFLFKAKIVLSNWITQNVAKVFQECKTQYECGQLTDYQLAARLIGLKERAMRPEELTTDNLDDSLNFDPIYIKRYEEDYELQKIRVGEREEEIEVLKTQIAKINKIKDEEKIQKEKVIEAKNKEIENKDAVIRERDAELEEYRQQEKEREEKRNRWKKRGRFVIRILLRILCVIIISLVSYFIARNIKEEIANMVGFIITIVTVVFSVYRVIINDYKDIIGE